MRSRLEVMNNMLFAESIEGLSDLPGVLELAPFNSWELPHHSLLVSSYELTPVTSYQPTQQTLVVFSFNLAPVTASQPAQHSLTVSSSELTPLSACHPTQHSLTVSSSQINQELEALARELSDSARDVGWFDIDASQEQDVLRSIQEAQDHLLSCFFHQQSRLTDIVKSLHQPLDIIPASLHPAD